MSLLQSKLLGLALLCAALVSTPTALAQSEVVSLSRRAYGPDDVGRLVDANWNPVGRERLALEVLTGPGSGVNREVRTSLTANEATANAGAFPTAAAMRRAAGQGYVRVVDIETVYQAEPSSIQFPVSSEDRFYIHAVHVGRVYQRQFYGDVAAVAGAVSQAAEGRGTSREVRSARLLRGFQAPRTADEARLLAAADEVTVRSILRARGRASGVLVVFRRVTPPGEQLPRGSVTMTSPVEVPVGEGGYSYDEPQYDPNVVNRLFRTRQAQFLRCYERAMMRNPELRGVVTVAFTLTPDGRVANAVSRSQDMWGEVTECVSQAVERFRTNPPPEVPVRFEVRMTMVPRE